jgi:hypothetical protein
MYGIRAEHGELRESIQELVKTRLVIARTLA